MQAIVIITTMEMVAAVTVHPAVQVAEAVVISYEEKNCNYNYCGGGGSSDQRC